MYKDCAKVSSIVRAKLLFVILMYLKKSHHFRNFAIFGVGVTSDDSSWPSNSNNTCINNM